MLATLASTRTDLPNVYPPSQQLNKQLWNATDKLQRTKDLFAEKKERMTANTLALREE